MVLGITAHPLSAELSHQPQHFVTFILCVMCVYAPVSVYVSGHMYHGTCVESVLSSYKGVPGLVRWPPCVQQQCLLTDHRSGSSSCPEQYLTL